ncbi:tRNA (N(6)-L-threonylcarbamoyladenosine(37)-C(2))-methylthiotransferase MtaB, partial [Coprococcus sp. MSK.21.13]|nr:tRNA (N(6)-L-threonylcarbamoyladenosine(37)-C(2))-methylthiotransferase MtaB [Coprococcus sp. MSK.21.13]
DGNIKEERSNILIELNKKLEKNFMEKFLGKEFQVLYEEKSNLYEDAYEGYTQNYIKVVTKSDMNLQGKIVNTIIKSVKEDYVLGKLK